MTSEVLGRQILPRILSFGKDPDALRLRNARLAADGWLVDSALSLEEAEQLLSTASYTLAILGAKITPEQRKQLVAAVRARSTYIPVVMLYDGSISDCGLADAVISVHSFEALLETVRYFHDRFTNNATPTR